MFVVKNKKNQLIMAKEGWICPSCFREKEFVSDFFSKK